MRIFVGGLSYATSSSDLRGMFEQAGQVVEASVVEDRFTRESKGFGFVDMPDAGEARAAISRFNGASHNGRSLTVNEAKPREERGSYSGGGGGSRGGSRGGYNSGGGRY